MKKMILGTTIAIALSTSSMAFDLVDKNDDIIIRVGIDLEGSHNDAEYIKYSSTGNTCSNNGKGCGKYGLDRDQGYELGIGIEEQVNNFEFGTRKMLTFYNYGDSKFHNGKNYISDITNNGIEASYEGYYKLTQYFKPSVGLGAGINRRTSDAASTEGNSENYDVTFHVVAGISGEIIAGLGYYATYKYRFADNSETWVPTKHYDGSTGKLKDMKMMKIESEGVSGDQWMVGVSWQF